VERRPKTFQPPPPLFYPFTCCKGAQPSVHSLSPYKHNTSRNSCCQKTQDDYHKTRSDNTKTESFLLHYNVNTCFSRSFHTSDLVVIEHVFLFGSQTYLFPSVNQPPPHFPLKHSCVFFIPNHLLSPQKFDNKKEGCDGTQTKPHKKGFACTHHSPLGILRTISSVLQGRYPQVQFPG
jgi:hypothetical protein